MSGDYILIVRAALRQLRARIHGLANALKIRWNLGQLHTASYSGP